MNQLKKKIFQSVFDVSDVNGVEVRERERQRNREILTKLIDLIEYLARQGQACRSHAESKSSNNRGIFLELADVSRYDIVLNIHMEKLLKLKPLKQGLRNQNDVIVALGTYIWREVQS